MRRFPFLWNTITINGMESHSALGHMDRLLQTDYGIGIFTSYKLYAPKNLDVTTFVKIENLG